MKIHRDVTEEGDELLLRFRFQDSLTEDQKLRVEYELGAWYASIFDADLANNMDDVKWYTKRTLAVIWLDTGGNDPALSVFLNILLREINSIATLKEVRINPY